MQSCLGRGLCLALLSVSAMGKVPTAHTASVVYRTIYAQLSDPLKLIPPFRVSLASVAESGSTHENLQVIRAGLGKIVRFL